MKLLDLQPHFVRYETRDEEGTFVREDGTHYQEVRPVHRARRVESLDDAQGVAFLCPLCFAANSGDVGTHWCEVSFENRGVLPDQGSHGKEGKPTRWQVSGTGLTDLTTQPSIQLEGGCAWHGFITNGEIT